MGEENLQVEPVSTPRQILSSFVSLFKVKKSRRNFFEEDDYPYEDDDYSSCDEEMSTIEMLKSLDVDHKHWNFMKTVMKYSVGAFVFHLVCRIVYEKTINKSKVNSKELEACRKLINIVCKTTDKNFLG